MADDADLIAAIYDTTIDPSRWAEVVKRIVEATKSVAGGIHIQQTGAVHLSALHDVDPFYAKAYVEFRHKEISHKNNFFPAVLAAPGEVRAHTSITQSSTFKASQLFNEIMRPQGWADSVAIGLLLGPDFSGYLGIHRSPDAIWVEPKEWHLLETLAPHLKRAAEIHQLLSHAKAATDSLGAAVAAAGFAAFLLTEDCRVVFANAKADDLVRRGAGLRYERGRLAAATPSLTHRLQAANLNSTARRFAPKFGLTGAETRLVAELIRGNGFLAAAAALNITEATARTHAKRIFDKTGTHRQAELIRRFFEISLPGSPSPA
jgi:DNA-binding CsgD family transcriptional regulator